MRALPQAGATYQGLGYALGITTPRAVFKAVARAEELGLVVVVQTGRGRGAKAVIRIGPEGARLLTTMGL